MLELVLIHLYGIPLPSGCTAVNFECVRVEEADALSDQQTFSSHSTTDLLVSFKFDGSSPAGHELQRNNAISVSIVSSGKN